MPNKYTRAYLKNLENIIKEANFVLRYEKGTFQSGYCLIKDKNIAIINQYFSLEGKINSMLEIIKDINLDESQLSEKSRKILQNLPKIYTKN